MNFPLIIYLILIFFYSIWITINCDKWSANLFKIYDLKYKGNTEDEEEERDEEGEKDEVEGNEEDTEEENEEGGEESDLIKGGENMKYYLLLIVGINMIVNIFVEWVIMGFVRNCYENKLIKDYKSEVENEKLIEAQNNILGNINDKEAQIFKYQRIYYYERRKRKKKVKVGKTNITNNIKIYSSSSQIDVLN